MITGIRPAVAQTMVAIDTGFTGVVTLATLSDGLQHCLRAMG